MPGLYLIIWSHILVDLDSVHSGRNIAKGAPAPGQNQPSINSCQNIKSHFLTAGAAFFVHAADGML